MNKIAIIAMICLSNCTNSYYLHNSPMFSFHFFNYPGKYLAQDKSGNIELDIKDSVAFLQAILNRYHSDAYNLLDTLKPYFGTTCIKHGPLYGCPCPEEGIFSGRHCDCEDCLDSTKSIIFFRGKLSQIYIGMNGYMFCNLEDTVGSTVFWHRIFNFKIPNSKIKSNKN